MAGLRDLLRGTIETIFQIGIGGPQLKNNSGVLETRNADDNAYAVHRGGTPVGDDDLVTKLYADSLSKPIIVGRQADTSAAIPNNTAVRGYVVVTTAGTGASIGDILYDDGSNSGLMTILPAVEGRVLAITDALAGGTATFEADSLYIWDADGSSWLKIGDIGAVTGGLRVIRYAIGLAATTDSATQMPANARVNEVKLEITTQYDPGTAISIGILGSTDLLMLTSENNPQQGGAPNTWRKPGVDISIGGTAIEVRTTITNTPSAGAGFVTVIYSVPNA